MPGYDSLGGLDMHAAFQKGMSSFAVWKEAVPQSPEISSSLFYLAAWLYLHLAKCCLWTWEQRNHLLFDFCCVLTSKSLSVLCKFTALHYRNTWLYSPIFPNADNCQDWLIKRKVGRVILLTSPSSHHVSIYSLGNSLKLSHHAKTLF